MSRLKLCAFVMSFVTPIAGALMLMVSIIKSIYFFKVQNEIILIDFHPLALCILVGIMLIASGFILLAALIQDKLKLIFIYLILSTPSLVFLMSEVVTVVFLDLHFKIAMIVFTVLMLCDQVCVFGFFILLVRKKRTGSMEYLVIYYEDGCFSNSVSRDHSFDSISI